MHFNFSADLASLASYLPRFLAIVGEVRWFKRVEQLDADQKSSFFMWKIVSDHHWLEMAIGHQYDVLSKEGRLIPELADPLTLAALHFAGSVVEIHTRLSERGRRQLEGRLRDSLKAKIGFAALYLEIDLSLRLISQGFHVSFPDLEGTANFDLEFTRGKFVGEVECKSLSADAGRRIHRKEFYRYMEAIKPALEAHAGFERQEILLITLRDRLPSNLSDQKRLRKDTAHMLSPEAPDKLARSAFSIERSSYAARLGEPPTTDQQKLYSACKDAFGENLHIAGALTDRGGCIVVMRCEREDDTSKPWLEAMRKAADQFSGQRPSFVAVQFNDISAPDLMLPHLRRRAGILSYALFHHYGAAHINATYICGFSAVVARDGHLGSPAFAVSNPTPRFDIDPAEAAPFLVGLSDADFASAIGAPLPADNISHIEF